MNTMDCATCSEQLGLEIDGRLPEALLPDLEGHLAGCTSCREERRALGALERVLERSRIGVRRGFADEVMSRLPAAGWEGSSPRAWRLPVALMALLAATAAALAGFSSARLDAGLPFLGALAAVADLFSASLIAGAGMLGASWQGIGMAVAELFATSTGNLVAFVVLVVAVNGLLFMLLRRRPVTVRDESRSGGDRR